MEFKSMCVGEQLYESNDNAGTGKSEFDRALFELHMNGLDNQEVGITLESKNGSEQLHI